MSHHDLLLVVGLLFAVTLLTLAGPVLGVAQPLMLVMGGLAIALIPELPPVHLESDLVFLIFLPPLLYEAAWFTDWREFWKWRRSISMLAFGLVFFTSGIVALVTASVIPDFTLALGFLLGGIVTRGAARTKAALDELRTAIHAVHAGGRDFRHSIIDVQREALDRIREAGTYDQEVVRKMESMLDLEEARLNG